jgi:7-carboxy-7-deazaguanine synthase
MSKNLIPVLEIFGPTIQGEGMVIGQKTMFVRTAGCDYSCSWCDSAFTWDGSAKDEIRLMNSHDILNELHEVGKDTFQHVTISGGNPALIKQLDEFIDLLHEKEIKVALETQGSKWQEWFLKIDDLTLSPKPPSSNMHTDWEVLDQIVQKLSLFKRSFSLKVVVFDDMDLKYAIQVHQRYPDISMYLQVGNDDLKESDTERVLARLLKRYEWLVGEVMNSSELKQVRVLPQLHAWLWGNKRGV